MTRAELSNTAGTFEMMTFIIHNEDLRLLVTNHHRTKWKKQERMKNDPCQYVRVSTSQLSLSRKSNNCCG